MNEHEHNCNFIINQEHNQEMNNLKLILNYVKSINNLTGQILISGCM